MISRLGHLMSCFFLVRVGYVPTRSEKAGVGMLMLLFAGSLYYITRNALSPVVIAGIPTLIFFAKAAQNEKALASSSQDDEDNDSYEEGGDSFL